MNRRLGLPRGHPQAEKRRRTDATTICNETMGEITNSIDLMDNENSMRDINKLEGLVGRMVFVGWK
jgi:hypothetical protein